jgi:hypothetical protein
MARHTYIITFDAADPDVDAAKIRDYIRDSDEFSSWWNHIPLVFLVTSELDADGISRSLRSHTNASFLVMRVMPEDSEGSLPRRGWEWIRRRSEPSPTYEHLSPKPHRS